MQKFEPSDDKPEKHTYFLFGKGKELFLPIRWPPPDFDQIVSVKVPVIHFTGRSYVGYISVVFQDRTTPPLNE